MGSTFVSLNYHVTFSTKYRKPMIDGEWRDQLHQYLGGTVKGLNGVSKGVGGIDDHVHLLVGLKSTHCLADFMRELKKSSSAWIHSHLGIREFSWQEGYGAFTVSPSTCDRVRSYIANQEEHHRKITFQDELAMLLKQAGIEYDPKWLV